MKIELKTLSTAQSGFTLIETLIALTITSLILATLIPIAQMTVFNERKLEREFEIVSSLSRYIWNFHNEFSPKQDVIIRQKETTLAPFSYPKGTPKIWQPVLVRLQSDEQAGTITQIEMIQLKLQTQ